MREEAAALKDIADATPQLDGVHGEDTPTVHLDSPRGRLDQPVDHGSGVLDNPDERVVDEVRTFTATTLSFALIVLNGTFTAVAFAGVLWTIGPLRFGAAVGYAAPGSLLAVPLGRPLVGLNYRQFDREPGRSVCKSSHHTGWYIRSRGFFADSSSTDYFLLWSSSRAIRIASGCG
jgi:hypothetical protein